MFAFYLGELISMIIIIIHGEYKYYSIFSAAIQRFIYY